MTHPDISLLNEPSFQTLSRELTNLSESVESGSWIHAQWELLKQSEVLQWGLPTQFGGLDVSSDFMNRAYFEMSKACLTTTFVLTQRNAACARLAACDNENLKAELFPRICSGEIFTTVGISHLTTSRRHLNKPVLEAIPTSSGYRLQGFVPWVSGAGEATIIVTGATCADQRQMLLALETSLPGVTVDQPARMLSLNASLTASVKIESVELEERALLAGPVENVMQQGFGGGTGSLTTSALALGRASRSLAELETEAQKRPDLYSYVEPFKEEEQELLDYLVSTDSCTADSTEIERMRQQANSFCLRTAQALMTASKGAGFIQGHPAERAIREAMFFLVWSCPQPVALANLREFACLQQI